MSSPSLVPIKNLLGPFFIGVVVSSMCEATLNVFPEIDKMEADYMVWHVYNSTCTFLGTVRVIGHS